MPDDFYRSPFQVDHIIARQHGGDTSQENLAYACFHCNTRKGPNVAGVDPESGEVVQLFHPVAWEEATLIGLSSSGRATIRALAINDPDSVAVRRALIEEGVFPIKPS